MTKTLVADRPQPRSPQQPVCRSQLSYVGAGLVTLGWVSLVFTRNGDSESSLPDIGEMVFVVANFTGLFLAWLGRRRSSPRTATRRTGTAVLVGVCVLVVLSVLPFGVSSSSVTGGGTVELPVSTPPPRHGSHADVTRAP